MKPDPFYISRCAWAVRDGKVTATLYRRGAVVTGWPKRFPGGSSDRPPAKRGRIGSQSARSLIRASFAIANSHVNWEVMITLTFRTKHEDPKECLRWWLRQIWPDGPNNHEVCWFQEYQERGVVHYHVLTTWDELSAGLWEREASTRVVRRSGGPVCVVGGGLETFIAGKWLQATGDKSPEARAFNFGGIAEFLTNPEAAGAYLGFYAKKLAQKTLPDDEAPQGRWWWMSDVAAPTDFGSVTLTAWHMDTPHKLVFDKARLRLDPPAAANKLDSV